MTLREIGLLTIAKLGHDGHQLRTVRTAGVEAPVGRGYSLIQAVQPATDKPCAGGFRPNFLHE